MMYVKGEKFKDRMEAAEWCMDNKPLFGINTESETWEAHEIREQWQNLFKAVKPI